MRKFFIISSILFLTNFSAQSWTQTGKLTPVIRRGGDSFGFDLLLKNNVLYSSAYGNTYDSDEQNSTFKAGSFYIFERLNNSWVKKNKLVPNDRENSDEFGKKFALGDDNKLFISAWQKKSGTSFGVGAVYLFNKDSNGNWVQTQKITPPTATAYTHFGNRLSADSNTLAIGSQSSNVTIYEYNSNTQKFNFKQTFPSTYNADTHVYNNRVFAGVSTQNVNGTANAGQVIIYKKNITSNIWEINQTINSPVTGDTQFGFTTYANGDYLFITAAYYARFVAIYKFNAATDQYTHVQTISNGSSYFGSEISMENDLLAIGAPGATNTAATGGGAVFLYKLENNLWVQKQKIYNNDSNPYDGFGYGLSVNNNSIAVGAPDHDFDSTGGNISASTGAVYFFNDLSSLGTKESAALTSYQIYPNPFIENISIRLDKKYDYLTTEIFDMSGKKIYTNSFSHKQSLDLGLKSLISGTYQLNIYSKDKKIITSRIIKK